MFHHRTGTNPFVRRDNGKDDPGNDIFPEVYEPQFVGLCPCFDEWPPTCPYCGASEENNQVCRALAGCENYEIIIFQAVGARDRIVIG